MQKFLSLSQKKSSAKEQKTNLNRNALCFGDLSNGSKAKQIFLKKNIKNFEKIMHKTFDIKSNFRYTYTGIASITSFNWKDFSPQATF